jgi:hypothetical protein
MTAILGNMVRRCLPIVLAVIVATAPVALDVCQLTCASAMAQSHSSHEAYGHSCHEDVHATGTHVRSVPHACGHSDELPGGPSVSVPTVSAQLPLAVVGLGIADISVHRSQRYWSLGGANFLLRADTRTSSSLRI